MHGRSRALAPSPVTFWWQETWLSPAPCRHRIARGIPGYSGAGCVDQTTKIRKRVRQVQYEAAIVVWRGVLQGAHRSSGTEEQGTKRAKKQAAGCRLQSQSGSASTTYVLGKCKHLSARGKCRCRLIARQLGFAHRHGASCNLINPSLSPSFAAKGHWLVFVNRVDSSSLSIRIDSGIGTGMGKGKGIGFGTAISKLPDYIHNTGRLRVHIHPSLPPSTILARHVASPPTSAWP